jgi:methylphosphotriester-DNA--protein-cysteine methyltransferase
MIQHSDISDNGLRKKIRKGEILFGGNRNLKIYGLLSCPSGKRMKRENRVFFVSAQEAQQYKYRPCGRCMKAAYKKWKDEFI